MSNALQTLRFEDTEVTALDCNTDEPVFVASPIAKKLAYERGRTCCAILTPMKRVGTLYPPLEENKK